MSENEASEQPEVSEATPQDVLEYLKEQEEKKAQETTKKAVAAGESVDIDLDPEVKAMVENHSANWTPAGELPEEKEKPPAPTSRINPVFEDEFPIQAKAMAWTLESEGGLGSVDVTDTERSLYLKGVLNDKTITFDIHLMKGRAKVRCHSATSFDIDVVFAAARKDQEEDKITKNLVAFSSRVLLYSVLMQVEQFNDITYEPLKFHGPPYPKLEDAVAELRNTLEERFLECNWPRWNLLLTAVRKFEVKLKICNDNLLNENFWELEDIG